jgi:hypothetical protein
MRVPWLAGAWQVGAVAGGRVALVLGVDLVISL